MFFWPALVPSLAYWVITLTLMATDQRKHVLSVPVSRLVACQLTIDVLQSAGTCLTAAQTDADVVWTLRVMYIMLGLAIIDIVEYWAHRALHTYDWLRKFHKTHHRLTEVHPLGTFYNHPGEVAFTGSCLAVCMTISGISPLELCIANTVGTACTVIDHSRFGSGRHRRHHAQAIAKDLAQPFWGGMDMLFGTVGSDKKTRPH